MGSGLSGNPRMQAVVFGGLGLVLLAVMWLQFFSGGGAEAPPPADPAAEAPAPDAAPGADAPSPEVTPPSERADASPAPAPEAAPGAAPEADSGAIRPSRGLPLAVVEAQARGRTVVLFVHQPGGLDDAVARRAVRGLQGHESIALFSTPVANIASFRRITEALDLSRTPALVVIRPGSLEGPLDAEIRYGPMDRTVVMQAVRDARYRGPEVPSYPHR